MNHARRQQEGTFWYLEGYTDEQKVIRRIPVRETNFIIGRQAELPLTLNVANISRQHAELYFEDNGALMVRDLESRNGTFVNRKRIRKPMPLRCGDVVHFGKAEFRVGMEDNTTSDFSETLEFDGELPAQFLTGTPEFLELMRNQAVQPAFQPLVTLPERVRFGYEILGRGCMKGLSSSPHELFNIALSLGQAQKLSQLFRRKAVEVGRGLPETIKLFMNIHPTEMQDPEQLLESLQQIRLLNSKIGFVLEIHEALVSDPGVMRELRAELRQLKIELAYDDFGAGQARLVELAEVPPDYLKFDRCLVQSIHEAAKQRQDMVRMLVKFAHDVGAVTLAEGVETVDEADACAELGFQTAQGFLFGRPASIGV